ncbi:MAG: hypothetical protein PHC97_03575 [Patescibacteria group bacterium]|nr:hypothetical protein [Patescibacteria group bacterium]
MQKWLRNYGLIPKILLAISFFIWLGGLNIYIYIREEIDRPSYVGTLDSFDRPPEYSGPKFEDWAIRKQKAVEESNEIIKAAGRKKDFTITDYFRGYENLMNLEDKYHIWLTAPQNGPLQNLLLLRGGINYGDKNKDDFIARVQERAGKRNGIYNPDRTILNFETAMTAAISWLTIIYLKLMLFWLLMFLIRFKEDEGYNNLSLKDELIICPKRFVIRLLFWPRWCLTYPLHEDTAEAIRYLKLKVRFLQNKHIAYQLSESEERWLRSQARQPIKIFEKTLKELREFEISPCLMKKSLAIAYLSLLLGILLQPVIVLAAKSSSKMNSHFYDGQARIEMVVKHDCNVRDGPINDFSSDQGSNWLELPVMISQNLEIDSPGLWEFIKPKGLALKPKKLPDRILHIPIYLAV